MAIASIACLSGCVADTPPRPRQPQNIHPAKLIPAANGAFIDTDANRYRDTSTVVVYVMGNAPAYQLPIAVTGEFLLRLEDPKGRLVAEWKFDHKETAAAMRTLPPGPGFVFEMDIRKSPYTHGSDVIEQSEAELLVTFIPDEGDAIKARTSAVLLIGPVDRGTR